MQLSVGCVPYNHKRTRKGEPTPTYAYAINLPSPTTRPPSADRHKTAELGWCGRASGNRHTRVREKEPHRCGLCKVPSHQAAPEKRRGSYKAHVRKPARVRVGGEVATSICVPTPLAAQRSPWPVHVFVLSRYCRSLLLLFQGVVGHDDQGLC